MKISRLWVSVLLSLSASNLCAQFAPAPGTASGLPETIEAIDSARVTTRILYITAHPDDESAGVLTYLARGLHADVALLSLTRGEGGQNALGPEQAPQLGLIRTQELLAATRGYGIKLYFTSAKDFGYSKTPEETEKIWGHQVLDDMVYLIRQFRPNTVINNWGGVHGGHGHHQAAGMLTPQAVQLAADPSYKTNASCEDCEPWTVSQILDLERGSEHPAGFLLPLDAISPLYGKSWRQLGIESFANHRTQGITGFLASPFFQRPVALKREDGTLLDATTLAVALPDRFKGCNSIENADRELAKARLAALQLSWKEAGEKINRAAEQLDESPKKCGATPFSQREEAWEQLLDRSAAAARIERAARLIAGLDISALADRNDLAAGEEFHVTVRARCRLDAVCKIGDAKMLSSPGLTQTKKEGDLEKALIFSMQVQPDAKLSGGLIGNASLQQPGEPDAAIPAPLAQASVTFHLGGREYVAREPVQFLDANTTRAQLVPLRIVPAYTLSVEPASAIEIVSVQHQPLDILLRVHSYSSKPSSINVGLDLPAGWTSSSSAELKFDGSGDRYAKLHVTPPSSLQEGNAVVAAYARRGQEKFNVSLDPLPSMPTILWEQPAQCIVHAFDINVPKNLRIGYITAEGEPVPDSLRMLGIQVNLLDAAALNFSDLSRYDAIVAGVRAYELRSELAGANQRLLDYVSNGGTLVVQYERDFAWDGKNYSPYPAKIDGGQAGQPLPRITDETAAVNFLKPADPLLNSPNKITSKDFDGWVQERGLYFWTDFDAAKYTPLLSMHDPNEKDLNGALVYAKYGKGTYIYTGLAFFRQLPEGVPGAYRLFVNLLSASRPQ